jgi:hypothetical protein
MDGNLDFERGYRNSDGDVTFFFILFSAKILNGLLPPRFWPSNRLHARSIPLAFRGNFHGGVCAQETFAGEQLYGWVGVGD